MRKYKLIKKLPFENSPKIGYISKPKEGELHYYNHNWFKPKDYPEFWEEVVEKDYEILSFKRNGNFMSDQQRKLATLQKDGSYLHVSLLSTTGGVPLENMIKMSLYKIYSVKRLFDGEVFTVGDLVKRPHYKQPFKINHIHIAWDMVWLHSRPFVEGTCTHTLDENTTLNEAIKQKQPLFTAEDGVDIFEGETYYYTNKEFILVENIAIKEIDYKRNCKVIRFSTKEAAKEYILINKPCLSLNDIKSLRKNELGCILVSEKDLKELVKSRL